MSLAHPPIPEHLRPHVWAKSMYAYPAFPNLPVHSIAEFLFGAINIASNTPFRWDFIDTPTPGSLLFVWMSPQTFASPPTDGYQYLDPETTLHLSVGDKVVEVYEHKYGYNPRTEGMTGYVRRRFHLVQGGNPQLWLIHYLRAPDEDRLPVTQNAPLPYLPRPYPLPTLAEIKFTLSNTGQLVSFKNQNTIWPPNMPPAVPQQHYQQPYMNRGPQGHPAAAYRPPQPPIPVPGNKRVKIEEEEEEDTFIPRDIAAQRFIRWTEWMEEILSSGYNIRDILPPPGPLQTLGFDPKELPERVQALENDIRISKQRHEENLQKFKSSCKVWKDGTKKLSMTSNNPVQDGMSIRVDGVAAAAKDAESAVSLAMTQPSRFNEVEEINQQVLVESGIPNAKIRKVQKVRPVGKHIEFQPAKRHVAPPGRSLPRSPVKNNIPGPVVQEEQAVPPQEVEMESEVGEEDAHANEAFEAMEAMDFDADVEFDYDSENHGNDDLAMDMGVD